MPQTILGIIPARGGSKGLPRKNILPLAGVPLIHHTIAAAKASRLLTAVVVNTDDDEIESLASDRSVQVYRRPEAMGSDTAKVDPMLIWTAQQYEAEYDTTVDVIVLLYPTAPLRPASAIDGAIRCITDGACDSALTLVRDGDYLWQVDGPHAAPTNYNPRERAPRQQESWNQWRENKAVYAMKRDLLFETGCRLGGNIGYHEMSPLRSLDIDDGDDLAIAEAVLRSGRIGPPPSDNDR